MSKVVLIIFSLLTGGSLMLTYDSSSLQGIDSHSSTKHIRSSHIGYSSGSSGGGFRSGK